MNPIVERLRTLAHRLYRLLLIRYWFPHVPLAILVALGGIWLLQSDLGQTWQLYARQLVHGRLDVQPRLLPSLLIGGGMLAMALGLLLRSRVAWNMALLLVLTAVASVFFTVRAEGSWLLAYFVAVLVALLVAWRQFDRSSVAASTLFAATSVAMLLMYATFGSYYLGAQYKPPITDLTTALYYAMVTMSTVGYGDIAPQSAEAKLFTVSVIVLGVAVFATSLTAVIAPMVNNSLQRIINRKGKAMKRENHFIVIGDTPLAVNTVRELVRRGRPVTRILRETAERGGAEEIDIVTGDPSSVDVLRQSGAQRATAVLAMLADDSENAFVVLAVKDLHGSARTFAAVNDARHLSRVKLVQPDVIIAPQVLGGELTAMLLTGEEVDADFVMHRVFQEQVPELKPAPAGGKAGD